MVDVLFVLTRNLGTVPKNVASEAFCHYLSHWKFYHRQNPLLNSTKQTNKIIHYSYNKKSWTWFPKAFKPLAFISVRLLCGSSFKQFQTIAKNIHILSIDFKVFRKHLFCKLKLLIHLMLPKKGPGVTGKIMFCLPNSVDNRQKKNPLHWCSTLEEKAEKNISAGSMSCLVRLNLITEVLTLYWLSLKWQHLQG